MPNILIAEDDLDIQLSLVQALTRDGHVCFAFTKGQEALDSLKLYENKNPHFHLSLLDLTLPDMDGLDILRYQRGSSTFKHLPCILVTARSEEIDRVIGLELGADDYVSKPYSIRELTARVKALLRRSQVDISIDKMEMLECGPISIDFKTREVLINNEPMGEFTRKEFELLVYLMENRGRVLSREKILQSVWGLDYLGESRTIDAHIRRVRSKLEPFGHLIETSIGVGYRMIKPSN